jgi:hypothetical protein
VEAAIGLHAASYNAVVFAEKLTANFVSMETTNSMRDAQGVSI